MRYAGAALAGMLDATGTPVPPVVIAHALVLERAAQMNDRPADPALIKAAHAAHQLPRRRWRKPTRAGMTS